VSVLDRKLLRDLWSMRAQVLAIMLLVGSGVAVFEMSMSNYLTLRDMQSRHYHRERFGDLFVSVKRAPLEAAANLSLIDGIAVVEPRIVQAVRALREDDPMSVAGTIVSLPKDGQPRLNRLRLVKGRWIDPAKPDEIIINEAYADARKVLPGDRLRVILNGRIHTFTVAGIALSPEYIFSSRSGLPLPDDRVFVAIWVARSAIASALDMASAFNDAVVRLAPGAHSDKIIAEINTRMARYGGAGAFERRDHPSHRFVEDELAEQQTSSIVLPLIFLGIASFLLNIVVGRLLSAQREQIASLKALGYPNAPILFHYLKLVSVMTLGGVLLGAVAGFWLANQMIELYRPFFRFPDWQLEFRFWLPLAAGSIALLAALGGAFNAVRRVVMLPAAVAMRPAMPGINRSTALLWIEKLRLAGPRTLMTLRAVTGHPLRAAFTVLGLALAVPLVTMGLFWWDALSYMIEFNFQRVERSDAVATLTQPVSSRAVREIARLPGVRMAEGQRIVPARIRIENRSYRTAIQGLPAQGLLKVPRAANLQAIDIPAGGIVLSRRLAEFLKAGIGQSVQVEVLEQARPVYRATIVGLADDILGYNVYMQRSALNRLMRESDVVNSIAMAVDPTQAQRVWQTLKRYPKIEAVSARASLLRVFDEKISGLIVVSAVFLTGFGLLIAIGIVYNAARVAFHERAWELASLRILGFSKGEVARVLFAELAILVAVSIPLGLLLAKWLIELVLHLRQNESFQLPAVISPATYGISALVVIMAAIASAANVRLLVNRLDLVSVLKTRD
jgi:putative ABC transport system permease protein